MPERLSKAKLSALRKFHQKKTRLEEGRFLIEGWHLLEAALDAGVRIAALVWDEKAVGLGEREELLSRASREAESMYEGMESQLDQLSETANGQGVCALVDRVTLDWDAFNLRVAKAASRRIVALDGVGDPGNCGTIIRAADWFGLDAVLLGAGCSEAENGKSARATMGSLFNVPIVATDCLPERLAELKEAGFSILTAELEGGASLEGFKWPERAVLVIGNEARGISPEVSAVADTRLFVPRFGRAESLNAAMAASVIMGHWRI